MGPFVASIYLSFLDYAMIGDSKFVGLANYQKMFTDDPRLTLSLMNTFYYVVVSVPLRQVIALAIAMLLDQKLKGIFLYRTIFYLPSVTSGVATAIMWAQIFGYQMGILNAILSKIGHCPYTLAHWPAVGPTDADLH